MPNYISDIQKTGVGLGRLAKTATGAVRSYMGSSIHRAGIEGLKMYATEPFVGSSLFGKLAGAAFMGQYAYEGYQKGGITGAIGGLARGGIESYAFGAASKALGITSSVTSIGLAAAAPIATGLFYLQALNQGVSMGQLATRPFVHEYMRKRAKLEMGSPIQDQFGTVSTMRRRSLMAMRQSRITARSALGMEGNRRYVPYMR